MRAARTSPLHSFGNTRSKRSSESGTKSRPCARAALRATTPASAAPMATACATSRWPSSSRSYPETAEEAPGPGALLAVHEPDPLARDVPGGADAERIAPGDREALLEVREGDDHHRPAAKCPADKRHVVLAGLLVEQVRAGDVRVASGEGGERGVARGADPAEALPGPAVLDPAGQDRQAGVAADHQDVRLQGFEGSQGGQAGRFPVPRRPRDQRIGGGGEPERIAAPQEVGHPAARDRAHQRAPGTGTAALAWAGHFGVQLSAFLAQPEQLLHPAAQRAGKAQRHQRGRLPSSRLEDAERLPADPGPIGELALGEAALLPGPPEPRLEPGHAPGVAWSTPDVNSTRHPPASPPGPGPAIIQVMNRMTALALAAALLVPPAVRAAERSVTFKVAGWHSKGDAYKTEVAVRSVKGVSNAAANFAQMTITVTYEDTQASRQQLEKAIADAGYSTAK